MKSEKKITQKYPLSLHVYVNISYFTKILSGKLHNRLINT